jgi:alpha-methylacyl-CoA racemase
MITAGREGTTESAVRPADEAAPTGPLRGVRVIELAGFGPGPFAGMLLSDMGAEVIRVERLDAAEADRPDVVLRGRRSIRLDLKSEDGAAALRELLKSSDVLCEGYRPGTLERLGFAPEQCWRENPALLIARVTGWGQAGLLAERAGHDVNYAALSGLLHAIGEPGGPPVIPLNIGADGGGGWMLAFGIVCGLLEARTSGKGQVIDVAMVDACALLVAKFWGEFAAGTWRDEHGTNRVDGGSHYYHVYRTADGRYLSVGAIEAKFYRKLLDLLGIADLPAGQHDREQWPAMTQVIADRIASETLAHWVEVFEGQDACVAEVLGMHDAPRHPQLAQRATYESIDGILQPAAAPRFSRTPGRARPIPRTGQDTDTVIAELGKAKQQ